MRRAAVPQSPDACPRTVELLVEPSDPLAVDREHYLCHRPFDLRFRWVLEESEALDFLAVPRTLLVPARGHPICVQFKCTASDLEVRTERKAKGYRYRLVAMRTQQANISICLWVKLTWILVLHEIEEATAALKDCAVDPVEN